MKESAKGRFFENECARTDTVFLPISEVCDGTVSLYIFGDTMDNMPLDTMNSMLRIPWIPWISCH